VTARLLDGAATARAIKDELKADVASLAARRVRPGLGVLLVGDDPASAVYVRSKTRACEELGLHHETATLPASATTVEVMARVDDYNRRSEIDGILVQLPLPRQHDATRVQDAIDPRKDVDGLHPENAGLLHQGRPRFVPCTPAGIVAMLEHYGVPLAGARAVILGRSGLVGRPLAALLTARDATVTLCHSRTRNLAAVCREADLLVAAIGRPGFVTAEYVREGATVVDVGITRLESLEGAPENLRRSERVRRAFDEKGRAIVGDVDFDDVSRVAGRLTPVPGGVGPLTVAVLLANTVEAARIRRGGREGP
jgi:methylenetetrahydrofolate dehydrogenase (NADP+) / methenyltetrahydrofolate cyclohydrolase